MGVNCRTIGRGAAPTRSHPSTCYRARVAGAGQAARTCAPWFTRVPDMRITATPLTAALAGLFSALVWPRLWPLFGDSGSSGSIGLVVATLVVIALPAHAFVVGSGAVRRVRRARWTRPCSSALAPGWLPRV